MSIALIGLVSFGIISFTYITIWFFLGLFFSASYLKKTNKLYSETDKVRETFKQYHELLDEIENQEFQSKTLIEKQEIIKSEDKKASFIFKSFSKILDAFDQRNNLIIAVFGNGLFLLEINNACKVEKWINNYKHTVEKWFEVVAPPSDLRIESKDNSFLADSSHLPNLFLEVVRVPLLRLYTGADDRFMTPFVLVVSLPHTKLAEVYTQEVKAGRLPIMLIERVNNSRLIGVQL